MKKTMKTDTFYAVSLRTTNPKSDLLIFFKKKKWVDVYHLQTNGGF